MGALSSKCSHPSVQYHADASDDTETYPDIRPPSRPRKKAVPAEADFKSIDDHAIKAPYNAGQSVKKLSEYLTQPAKCDMDRIRAFYRWIANNISYDSVGLRRKNNGDQKADVVLRRRQGVCEGYSNLFLELCREAKIPCKKIHGFSKSLGYIPEVGVTEESRTSHAWNIVYVNGQWGCIDATWGAGRLNDSYGFVKEYEELYFLTDPKDFVVKHFPFVDKDLDKSQGLQLLKKPLTLDEFNLAANPDTKGLVFGFRSPSHKHHKLDVNKECTVTFKTKKIVLQDISCILKRKGSGSQIKQCVLIRRTGKSRFIVRVSPPSTGTYELELYGRPDGATGKSLSRMITYSVDCKSAGGNVKAYPDHTGLWGIRGNVDVDKLGFSSDLKSKDVLKSKNGSFELRVEAKEKSKAIFRLTNREEKDLTRNCIGYFGNGFLTIRGNLPKEGYYKLVLFANSTGGTEYDQIGDFLIDCKFPHPDPPSYPLPGSLWGAKSNAETYGFTKQIYSKNIFTTGNGEVNIRLPTSRDVTSSLKLETSRSSTDSLTKYAISFNSGKMLLIKARLPKKGFYKLSLFAGHPDKPNARELDLVADFLIECKTDVKETKTFPKPYSAAQTYSCVLVEPLFGVLPANQKVRLRLRSKVLTRLLINNERYEKKSGDLFDVTFTTPGSGNLPVCGSKDNGSKFDWLYTYDVK